MEKPIRSTPWPTYDKGNVFVDGEDLRAPRQALENRLYFRYDYRQYGDAEASRFGTALRRYLGVDHALAVSSGTAAIALGLMSFELEPGSLVACPGFTFAATPSAILLAGRRPPRIARRPDPRLPHSHREHVMTERPRSDPRPRSIADTIAGYWKELLGVEAVRPDDDFIGLGGDSIRASMLARRIEDGLGVRPEIAELFTTLEQVAEHCEALLADRSGDRPGLAARGGA